MKILVTGSSGFIGRSVTTAALNSGYITVGQQRSPTDDKPAVVCEITSDTQWEPYLDGIDCIVHCAARVHQMKETLAEAKSGYQAVNVEGTLNLARQAVQAGVKRFVFISSIKVNGEFTLPGQFFDEHITQEPDDRYGKSKYQAELGLKQIAEETGLEVVIIRPPLVYGPGVRANFASMMKWVKKGIPLPFGAIHNQRSLVYLENLVDLIMACCVHPKAAGQTFLVSDDHDVTTTYLLNRIATSMGRSSRLIPIPVQWLSFGLALIGKRAIAQRLFGSLQLDISHTKQTLNWKPPVTFDDAIQNTVLDFLQREQQ